MHVDERLIHRWATGERPVSQRRSGEIVQAARAKHNRRADRETAIYAAMVESIIEPEARLLLLEIVSREVAIRAAVIAQLARQIPEVAGPSPTAGLIRRLVPGHNADLRALIFGSGSLERS